MEVRAYKDKKGNVLFVAAGCAAGFYGTCYRTKTGALKQRVNKDLPLLASREEAQADLDAYALQHELEAAEVPNENPDPETVPAIMEPNENGVYADPETLDVIIPSGLRAHVGIHIAYCEGGVWRSAPDVDCDWGDDLFAFAHLPSLNDPAFATRAEAIRAALEDAMRGVLAVKVTAKKHQDLQAKLIQHIEAEMVKLPPLLTTPPEEPPTNPIEPNQSKPVLTQDEKDEKKRLEHTRHMDLYFAELRSENEDLIRVKGRKKDADDGFNQTIKACEKRIEEVLCKMREEEQIFAGYMAPPPPGALPFDAPAPEPEPEAPNLDGEPATVPCGHCLAGKLANDTDCPRCMGTGNIVPQPEPEAETPASEPATDCLNCGHQAAAHFSEDGKPRRCVNLVCEGKGICNCPTYVPFDEGHREGEEGAAQ